MAEPRFRLDRTISLSLLFAVLLQSTSALLWAGAAEIRIKTVENHAQALPELNARLIRLEEQMRNQNRLLLKIEQRIDALPRQEPERHP